MLKYKILCIMKSAKNWLLFFCWLLLGNALALSNTIVDVAGVYTSIDIGRIELKIAEVEAFHNIEIDVVTCTSALPQVGFVVSSTGLTGRKLLINIPAGIDFAGIQTSQDIVGVFPVSSLERISEYVLRPLVGSRDYCLAALETLNALLIVDVTLRSLRFEDSALIEGVSEDSPEWLYTELGTTSHPVAYAFSEKIKLLPLIETSGIRNGRRVEVIAIRNGERVTASGRVRGGAVELDESNPIIIFDSPLESVGYIDDFIVDWFLKERDGEEIKIGSTRNKLFFTLSNRTEPGASYVGAFNYTCRYAQGAMNETDFINLVWKNFSTKRLRTSMFFNPEDNVEDVPLTYYAFPTSGVTGCVIAFSPDVNRDGECGAFMQLFKVLLETHGVEAERLSVSSKTPLEFFLVKNWKFRDLPPSDPGTSLYPYINYVGLDLPDGVPDLDNNIYNLPFRIRGENNEYTFYEETYTIDVSDESGLPGQNVVNPYSDFFGHYLLLINGRIYDPSYGKIYSSLEEFENESIEAFGKVGSVQAPGEERVFVIQLRKNNYDEIEMDDGL